MKRIIYATIITLLFSCKKEEKEPTRTTPTTVVRDCKCGYVDNIYLNEGKVINWCTGNMLTINFGLTNDYSIGDEFCYSSEW